MSFRAGLLLLLCALSACQSGRPPVAAPALAPWPRPPISMPIGVVRKPLPYRIVSFHRGRADKQLIRLAHDLGFNGVQFQIEGPTVEGVKEFAKRDADEHLVDFCHALGMRVTVWVHELSDVPAPWMPEYLGAVTLDNAALWALLSDRYDWMLRDAIPNVDGLVLTVVETQIRATDTAVLVKLAGLLRRKCDQYGKSLTVRTFVWYPDEFKSVMAAVNQFPKDTVIMSKCVPQDWNLRGIDAKEIGDVGGRPQIVEFDVAGEYFLTNRVANCMPELLKRQFEYAMSKNAAGICVRVDRSDDNVLHQPSEVNLWTLGMLASGASDDLDAIWNLWATNRFGAAAAPAVIRALKPTEEVVSEMLSIGPFAFGDTRYFPPLGDEDVFGQLHQSYWWDDFLAAVHEQAETGDAAFTQEVAAAKQQAIHQADRCLIDLELARPTLKPEDYAILLTRLTTNRVQLGFRAPMALAILHYRRMVETDSMGERSMMDRAIQDDLAALREAARPIYPQPTEITYLDRKWKVGAPEDVQREWIYHWAYQMDQLRRGLNPRVRLHRLPYSKWRDE